jgi:hypothetical protein
MSATTFGILNISYGESFCESNEEYMVDNCKKIPIMLATNTLNTPIEGVIAKQLRMMFEFLNEFGIEVVPSNVMKISVLSYIMKKN